MIKALANDRVDDPKIEAEQEYGDDHHRGRALDLLARRGGYLPHFGAHVVVKALCALRPRF